MGRTGKVGLLDRSIKFDFTYGGPSENVCGDGRLRARRGGIIPQAFEGRFLSKWDRIPKFYTYLVNK